MIEYIHLRDETPKRRACLCREFFQQIYHAAFPNPNQTESPETWLPLMGEHVPEGQPRVHIVLARDAEKNILGGVVFENLPSCDSWFCTYIAVRPNQRRHGIAAGLMREMVRFIGTHCGDAILFAEAENPTCILNCSEQLVALRRLKTLDGFGLRRLPLAYVQPALGTTKTVLSDLILLCYAPDDKPPYEQIPAGRVIAFLTEFYTSLGQADSMYLSRMVTALDAVGVLQVERLIA